MDIHQIISNYKPLYTDQAIDKTDHLFSVREEVKFLVPVEKLAPLLSHLRGHFYSKICDDGIVFKYNNLYFDTPSLKFFHMHRQGKYNRLKVRIRKYCNGRSGQYIECKEKRKGIKSKKKRKIIQSEADYLQKLNEPFLGALLQSYSVDPSRLAQTLDISYNRLHFSSSVEEMRLTIDYDIRVGQPGKTKKLLLSKFFILEIKYDRYNRDFLRELRSLYGLRPISFSKYCIGLCYLNHQLKRNKWKQVFKKYIDA